MIRQWSYGEVKKPETINYRTLKPERDGLFCERIFGPTKDWECHCGKYKKITLQGQDLRPLRRGGHQGQGAPGAHGPHRAGRPRAATSGISRAFPPGWACCWTSAPGCWRRFCTSPAYIVTDPGDAPLAKNQILTEKEYRDMREKYEDDFEAGMGAEAVKKLLEEIDLDELSASSCARS